MSSWFNCLRLPISWNKLWEKITTIVTDYRHWCDELRVSSHRYEWTREDTSVWDKSWGTPGILSQPIAVYYCHGCRQRICSTWCAMGHAACRWSDLIRCLVDQSSEEIWGMAGPAARRGGCRESSWMEKKNPCGWPLTWGIHSLKERERHQYENEYVLVHTGEQRWRYIVSSVTLWTLCYVRHNNDVIIDVKPFWRPFLLFSWRKRKFTQKLLVLQGNSCLYIQPVLLWTPVIGIYANSCLL